VITITVPNDNLCIKCKQYDKIPPKQGGIYKIYSKKNELLYIGKSDNLRRRLKEHMEPSLLSVSNTEEFKHLFHVVECIYVNCPVERDIYETYLINTLKPPLNRHKTFTYKTTKYNYLKKKTLEEQLNDPAFQALAEKIRSLPSMPGELPPLISIKPRKPKKPRKARYI